MPASTYRTTNRTEKATLGTGIHKKRNPRKSTNNSAPPSGIKLVRSPVSIFKRVYKYFFPSPPSPEPLPEPPEPEPELPRPTTYYDNIYENEGNFVKYALSIGIEGEGIKGEGIKGEGTEWEVPPGAIYTLTGGRASTWEEITHLFFGCGINPYLSLDDEEKASYLFQLYACTYPDSVGFNDAHYKYLQEQCHGKFFSISSDSENTLCPRPLRFGGLFMYIYKLIYNKYTKVYTLHFFGYCNDKGCKDVNCAGEGGMEPFVRGISIDHSYIYREGANEGVVMAGQVSIRDGIATFDNGSGHYRPGEISEDIRSVIEKIMNKVSFNCTFEGRGGSKKHKKKRKNNKKTKRRKPRSKIRSKKSKTKRIRKIR